MIEIVESLQPISHDMAVSQMVKMMLEGRIDEIRPQLDFKQGGVTYPQVEGMLGQSPAEVADILGRLTQENILESHFYDRLIFCPACNSMNLRPSIRCPKCGSANITRGRVFEHFACGKNGLEDEFLAGGKYICPHCGKQLRFLGTDYRSLGLNYKCHSCGAISNEIAIKWQCMSCLLIFADVEAGVQTIFSYRLNEKSRSWLEFDMNYKSKLIDFLRRQGYEVFEKAVVNAGHGSGANHMLDVLARRDDGFITQIIGIGIAINGDDEPIGLEEVFRFDNKAYDLEIHDKLLLAVPGLNNEARQFARRQRIKSFDIKELDTFLNDISNYPAKPVKRVPFIYKSRGQLLEYLNGQGYKIEERAKIRGRSGAEYIIDIIAYFDDGLFIHTISIGLLSAEIEVGLEAVSAYDTKAYDIGIHDKILVVSPRMSVQAKQFADQQRIRVIEVANPDGLK